MRIAHRRLAAFIALAAASLTAVAQPFPARPVRVVIGALAGDACDIMTRLITGRMAEKLGQQFVIDNRAGGSGTIGMAVVAKAAPDGYTLGCGQGGNLSIAPHSMKNPPFDSVKDFTGVALFATNYLALVINPQLPIHTVDEFIRHLKTHPGKVSMATNGEGAFLHFATESFRAMVGFEYLHVPFKGIAQIAQEIMGGRVDAAFTSFTGAHAFVTSGKLRLLGIAKQTRAPNYPDFPTVAETVPGFWSGGWFGLVAPAGTPKPIVDLLNREANAAMRDPEVKEKLTALGLDLWNAPADHLTELMRTDFEKYGKLARDLGIARQ